MLRDTERIEPLGNGVEIIVSDAYHFTTDTILLADFAQYRSFDKAVDLGTGCGTIPLLWARHTECAEVYGVEIMSDGAQMFSRSIVHNSLDTNIHSINADLKELKGILPFGYFSLVTCNPPYKLSGAGIISSTNEEICARHETECTLEDVISTGAKLLQFSGRLCICQRPERLTDAIALMRQYGVEPKRLRLVQGRPHKEPKLFLLEGKRGANAGNLRVMPTLVIENENGEFTDEMKSIYGCYKDGARNCNGK